MNKERMREIIESQLNENVTNFDYEVLGLVAIDIESFEDVLSGIINHPEIKSLFEPVVGVYICPECKRYWIGEANNCCGFSLEKTHESNARYSENLINTPTTHSSSCKEIVDNSTEGYEVKEIQETALMPNDPVCEHMGDCTIGSSYCIKYCQTNGVLNFQGHESPSSIRCAFEANNGGGEG